MTWTPNPTYKAAQTTPENWPYQPPSGLTPDREILGEYSTIVSRSKDIVRNNPMGKSAMNVLQNFVSPKGLKPIADERAVSIWNDFADVCEISGTRCWDRVYGDIVGAQGETGEVLILITRNPEASGVQQRLQLVEADRISTPTNIKNGKWGKLFIRNGVAFNEFGVEAGYFVVDIDPKTGSYKYGDTSKYTFYERQKNGRLNAILARRPDKMRPGETRQLPFFVSITEELNNHDDTINAAIARMKALSLVSVILESDTPEQVRQGFGETEDSDGDPQTYNDTFTTSKAVGSLLPNSMVTVPFGAKPHLLTPSGSVDVEKLVTLNAHWIASALDIPYELLTKDFSKSNYASAKLSYQPLWNMANRWNNGNSKHVATPIFSQVITEAWLKDDPRLDGVSEEELRIIRNPKYWVSSRSYTADPARENAGRERALDNNFSTEELIANEAGIDWRTIQDSREKVLNDNIEMARNLVKNNEELDFNSALDMVLRKNMAKNVDLDQTEKEDSNEQKLDGKER